MYKIIVFILLVAKSFAVFADDNKEKIFTDALKYTVKIKTSIKYPFGDNKRGSSIGAGFLIDREHGMVMTNAHVVSHSPSTVTLMFNDSEYLPTEKVYVDNHLDIAILKVDPSKIPKSAIAAPLSCTDLPGVGTDVGTFGHPAGFSFVGTVGVVSGINYKMETELMQIDAPINPGNSGGPLIDLSTGKVIGINTSILKNAQNTGFATSMKYACNIYKIVLSDGNPQPQQVPWAYYKNDGDARDVKVAYRYSGDESSQSNKIKAGDVILGIKGVQSTAKSITQLIDIMRGRGTELTFRVRHESGVEDFVTEKLAYTDSILEDKGLFVSGILFGSLDKDFKEFGGSSSGVYVMYVEDGTPAENMEIFKSDILHTIDGAKIETLNDLKVHIDSAIAKKTQSINLSFKRIGASSTMLYGFVERVVPIDSEPKYIVNNKK